MGQCVGDTMCCMDRAQTGSTACLLGGLAAVGQRTCLWLAGSLHAHVSPSTDSTASQTTFVNRRRRRSRLLRSRRALMAPLWMCRPPTAPAPSS